MCQVEMPRYICNKEVWALQILSVEGDKDGGAIITPVNQQYSPFRVDSSFCMKHNPQPDGYYVIYKDGYKSFSPKEPFEDGYSLIK